MNTDKASVLVAEAAMALRGQAPDAWESLLSALEARKQASAVDIVNAHPETVLTAQGRARGISELAANLSECREILEQAQKHGLRR